MATDDADDADDLDDEEPSPLRNYMELVRLPNVFTAVADVMMGVVFVREMTDRNEFWMMGLLALSSALLYAAGVVLNDVFDFDLDCRQRPERPLPSGRISREAGRRLGWQLLIAGLLPAAGVVLLAGTFRPAAVVVALAACIVFYDAWLKHTPLGPLGMGGCRMLNVLLGMSIATEAWQTPHWLVAGGIGLYITGVTWLARTEAVRSDRRQLAAAMVVFLAGVGLLAWYPSWTEQVNAVIQQQPQRWHLAMLCLGGLIAWQCRRALIDPEPIQVQLAVKMCILSLVILDAAVAYSARGVPWAVGILALLVPVTFFARWIDST